MDSSPQTRLPGSSPDEMFPVLTAERQARVLTHGRLRKVTTGEVVIEPDTLGIKFFVVVQGKLEVLRLNENREQPYAVCGPGMFTGELNMLSGRRSLVRIRASEPGELIEIERAALRGLVQTDSELVPNSAWLEGCVACDQLGFIKTGSDLSPEDLEHAKWPLNRAPYLLETSLPGVFAVGDVRAGNVKRVASAVGEGSIAVSFVHQALAD